jgi:glycosyltransferase involved in cell wall biosynthesis
MTEPKRKPKRKPKLLALCDSPTLQTGFARVAKNLLSRWHAAGVFEDIWVWGIGYAGLPHSIDFLKNRICPASSFAYRDWYAVPNLERFMHLLERDDIGETEGGFTHLWMLQDTFLLSQIARALRELCRDREIKTLLYFPVDAELEPAWADIIEAVDVPVAYCQYGKEAAIRALLAPDERGRVEKTRRRAAEKIDIIPHGVDTSIYQKLSVGDQSRLRLENRERLLNGRVRPEDLLIVNVNQHAKRKGLSQTLQILATLKWKFPEIKAKLMMHMPSLNENEQTDLRQVATQLGLVNGNDVFYSESAFAKGHAILPESNLNALYDAADLLITTSLGEGWGLPITEAMAAGTAVAGPDHTSISEILAEDRGLLFATLGQEMIPWDNSRLRPRTDIGDAAMKIANAWMAAPTEEKSLPAYARRGEAWARSDFLNWDRIAAKWLDLFGNPTT